ncbi:MAG: AzlC family ABC transporter permease [Proteobacteria bacterium]|nr:AzlC family ABC transporter permease [Pseudomonadota bacterium]
MFKNKTIDDNNKHAFATAADGLRTALPIVFAYFPLGISAGIVGAIAGLSPAEITLLSLLVYSGAAQFIFANMVNHTPAELISTIFLVNFRHFLYSLTFAQKIKHLPTRTRVAIGAQLTDEGFALANTLYQKEKNGGGLLAANMFSYFAWCSGNITGALIGESEIIHQLGADYMLTAMFAILLALNAVAFQQRIVPVAIITSAAILGTGLELYFPNPFNVLISAGVAASVGLFLSPKK